MLLHKNNAIPHPALLLLLFLSLKRSIFDPFLISYYSPILFFHFLFVSVFLSSRCPAQSRDLVSRPPISSFCLLFTSFFSLKSRSASRRTPTKFLQEICLPGPFMSGATFLLQVALTASVRVVNIFKTEHSLYSHTSTTIRNTTLSANLSRYSDVPF